LKTDKSSGPDDISSKVLKECVDKLRKPLAMIFRKSLNEQELPEDWKKASVTHIHKGGDKTEASNFRPVLLTSIPCKIIKSIIMDKVKLHLKSVGVSKDKQHGFLKGRSCLTNLLTSFEDWTQAVDKGEAVDVIYLDISIAFNSVPHKRLIDKLGWYGLSG